MTARPLPGRLPSLPPPPPPPIFPTRAARCPEITHPHRLYFVIAFDPRTVVPTLTLVYIGITSRWNPVRRFEEHVEQQPWADTIPLHDPVLVVAARLFILAPDTYCCELHAREAERDAILANRPLYNYEHNLGNPERITIPEQRTARAARDQARRLPYEDTWAAQFAARQAAREAGRLLAAGAAQAPVPGERWWTRAGRRLRQTLRQVRAHRWSRAEKAALGYSLFWLVASVGGWYALARWLPVATTWRLGGVSGAIVGMVVLWRTAPSKRRKRMRMRRAAHHAGVLALFGVLALLLFTGR
jgi:hypothetical protein